MFCVCVWLWFSHLSVWVCDYQGEAWATGQRQRRRMSSTSDAPAAIPPTAALGSAGTHACLLIEWQTKGIIWLWKKGNLTKIKSEKQIVPRPGLKFSLVWKGLADPLASYLDFLLSRSNPRTSNIKIALKDVATKKPHGRSPTHIHSHTHAKRLLCRCRDFLQCKTSKQLQSPGFGTSSRWVEVLAGCARGTTW